MKEQMTILYPRDIILQGRTTQPGLGDTSYIVFRNGVDSDAEIYILGFRLREGQDWQRVDDDGILCVLSFVRRLASSLEDFYHLPFIEIELQAYGAWMDGAR